MIKNIDDIPRRDSFPESDNEQFKNIECGDSWEIERIKCNKCNSIHFEVLRTGDYETTARCTQCNIYYIVHQG